MDLNPFLDKDWSGGSVKTEDPPAGEFGRSSGQIPGRDSSVENLHPPALSGAPVPAEAPVLTGESGYIRLDIKRDSADKCSQISFLVDSTLKLTM